MCRIQIVYSSMSDGVQRDVCYREQYVQYVHCLIGKVPNPSSVGVLCTCSEHCLKHPVMHSFV